MMDESFKFTSMLGPDECPGFSFLYKFLLFAWLYIESCNTVESFHYHILRQPIIQIIVRKTHQWMSIVLVQLLITKGKQFSMTSAQMRLFFI